MFAVIETGGKQYTVESGKFIDVEKLEKNIGEKIAFDALLVVDGEKTQVGTPKVKNAKVNAEVISHGRGEKLIVYKYKAKKNERNKQGHRQPFTRIKILEIVTK